MPLTLTILVPCLDPTGSYDACLGQFAGWRPAPELLCLVPAEYPDLAARLRDHPAQPWIITGPSSKAALIAAGVVEAQGTLVMLCDPQVTCGADVHRAIFRAFAGSGTAGVFFRVAGREAAGSPAQTDPLALTWTSLTRTPLMAGVLVARTAQLRRPGVLPATDALFDYRLAQQLQREGSLVPSPTIVECPSVAVPDSGPLIWQIVRFRCGTPLDRLELPVQSFAPSAPAESRDPAADPTRSDTPAVEVPAAAGSKDPASDAVQSNAPMVEMATPAVAEAGSLDPAREVVQAVVPPSAAESKDPAAEVMQDADPAVALPVLEAGITRMEAPETAPGSIEPIPGIGDTPLPAPDITRSLPAVTPIITVEAEGFAALFDEPEAATSPRPPQTLWERMNAALHQVLFQGAVGPTAQEVASPMLPAEGSVRTEETATSSPGAVVAPQSDLVNEPPTLPLPQPATGVDLPRDSRVPWSRGAVDPTATDPITAAELSQVRRTFTDVAHPAPTVQPRHAGRIIEIAITPPDFPDRRERQEGE